ncbi:EAL domain-containing protein [Ruminococcaceae bacterium OttesenSCG-928-I18]|nr:EAL domain-containing protein [Ruminococcaceae bacterium OttesenSCG-928-I18]
MQNKPNKRIDIDDIAIIAAIRRGLVMLIPLLLIGSFALILNIVPLPPYQTFITTFAGGFLSTMFVFINQVTFGIIGLGTVISISACYIREKQMKDATVMAGVIAAVGAFMVYNGMFTDDFRLESLGAVGMFTAIFTAISSSVLFCFLVKYNPYSRRMYTVGANTDFNQVISVILPASLVVLFAFLLNYVIQNLFGVSGFEAMFHDLSNALFDSIENYSLKALLFVAVSNFLWFFGIHGTNVLEGVSRYIFSPEMTAEVTANASAFLTKNVIDVFVFMGGSGTTISLLLAILLFGKQKNNRSLAKMATIPMFFNINELMVFGLPIVYNVAFFIPFIITPFVCIFTSWLAIDVAGIVPAPVYDVEWVTPMLFNGYQATGSIAGSLLQVFNVVVGALVYRFFLVRFEHRTNERVTDDLHALIRLLKQSESDGQPVTLLELQGRTGNIAKMLAADLEHVLKKPDSMVLHYQPQYDNHSACVGAEALLRWNHPRCGIIYPPLVVDLAAETGKLGELERMVFELVCHDILVMQDAKVCPGRISVNATAATLQDPQFVQFLQELLDRYPSAHGVLNIELTEQMSFLLGEAVENRLTAIRDMDILFSVDDFSMGHTSVKYLQSNLFEEVKLDGSLVKDMMENPRSEDIVKSIVQMSQSMHFSVLAEYVETEEQRSKLESLGVTLYQGWLFSKALPLDELIPKLQKKSEGVPCPPTRL